MKPDRREFKTETELCAAFIAWAEPQGYLAYAETAGWDILLVRKIDGLQIGIHAKLRFNFAVLDQVLSTSTRDRGPDHRAVLVPERGSGGYVCSTLGIQCILPGARGGFRPLLPAINGNNPFHEVWDDWMPVRRLPLPEYVPDVAAGASGPVQLTEWKIRALKLAVLLSRRGSVTRDDLKHLGLDPRRWIGPGEFTWLKSDDRVRFVAGERMPDLRAQHPRVWEEVEADFAKWAPKEQRLPEQAKLEGVGA